MNFGYSSDVALIRSLLLKHPRDAFINQANINAQWQGLNYLDCPDYSEALKEYEDLVSILKQRIPEVNFLPRDARTALDSIYVRDALLMTHKGAIYCRMGKAKRRREPLAMKYQLAKMNIPVLGSISGKGRVEGGDVVILKEDTLAVGLGSRTNKDGIEQLQEFTKDFIKEFVIIPLPDLKVPGDVLHLMSFISPISQNQVLVYTPLMPGSFRHWLIDHGYKLLEVPDEEFETLACNVLALSPGKCVMLAGNPLTRKILEKAGIEVFEFKGKEISYKGAGGPTCLTRPLIRID